MFTFYAAPNRAATAANTNALPIRLSIKQQRFCKSRFSEVGHLASMVRAARSVPQSLLISLRTADTSRKRRELDDAVRPRSRGLAAATRADSVGRLMSRQHVADASDLAVCTAAHGEPLEREGWPGARAQQAAATLLAGLLASRRRLSLCDRRQASCERMAASRGD